MRKLREAAVVITLAAGVSMIGAGVAAAGGEEPPSTVSITCEQDTGNNTLTTQTGGLLNIADSLNGGDADASANQQLCGLDNEDAENTAGTATGGGAAIVDIGLAG